MGTRAGVDENGRGEGKKAKHFFCLRLPRGFSFAPEGGATSGGGEHGLQMKLASPNCYCCHRLRGRWPRSLASPAAEAEPPVTGLKARTDGLTDGLASKHMPSYQQKHRFQKLTNTSATLTQFVEASAFRLNISIDIKNAYNGPRVCFCDLHKI